MQRDITGTATFKKVEKLFNDWLRAGSGEVVDFGEIALSPDGRTVAGTGTVVEKLEGAPGQRICIVDRETGDLKIVSQGPRTDRMPRWDEQGRTIAFLSDRTRAYDFQLNFLDLATGAVSEVPLDGQWVEYLQWSPDGARLLLGAAGQGVDLAGAQGGIPSPLASQSGPDWSPIVDVGESELHWRSLWIHDRSSGKSTRITPPGLNAWEAAFAGPDGIICVASDSPGEEVWYTSDLRHIDLRNGKVTRLYKPADQIGWISASPSGARFAFVEAVCSDRTIVAGDLKLTNLRGEISHIDTKNVDVTFTVWQGEDTLLYAGHRGFETVLGTLDVRTQTLREIWVSDTLTFGGAMRYPDASPSRVAGQAAVMMEGHFSPPTLTIIGHNAASPVRSFGQKDHVARTQELGSMKPCRWSAPDGREIQGWLLTPNGKGPHALVMDIHGGPVWMNRPRFVGRPGSVNVLLNEGYAVFHPNVRGSSGRGQDYARQVFGDMGGADAQDYLSGLDALTAGGIADPKRLGVMGGSYGGYMSSWLITQDKRFAAAVPVAPVTDWVSEHLTCHIPLFCEMFLNDQMTNPGGKYFTRSPVMFASNVKTPTLNICGAMDKNTPPGQALEFHHALLQHGVESVLLTYPKEGHGIRNFPAVLDYCSRVLDWFQRHMPAGT